MKARLEQRLEELKEEFEAGRQMQTELDARQANLKETLLRISGAIQVLQEELAHDAQSSTAALPSINGQAEGDAYVTAR